MARCSPFQLVILFAVLIVGVLSIVGWVGLGFYVNEKHNEDVYDQTTCRVNGGTIETQTCSEEVCTGTTDNRDCNTYYYDCYNPVWFVSFLMYLLNCRLIRSAGFISHQRQ